MVNDLDFSRRQLLRMAAAAAGCALVDPLGVATAGEGAELPTRPFGTSRKRPTMLALGTGRLAHVLQFDAGVELIRYAIDRGITYIDTARDYHAERHIGAAIEGRRKQLFIATKTLARDYDGRMRELEGSMKDLRTDRIDLWQVHSIGHAGGSAESELASLRKPDGVMKAMRRMREQRVVDLIGFTGHTDPRMMTPILADESLDFDAILFILSAAARRQNQRGWEDDVLPAAKRRKLTLIGMKIFGGGDAVGATAEKDKATPIELLRYAWDRGVPFANVGLHAKPEIDAAIAACRAFALSRRDSRFLASSARSGADDAALRGRFVSLALPFERPGYADVRPLV